MDAKHLKLGVGLVMLGLGMVFGCASPAMPVQSNPTAPPTVPPTIIPRTVAPTAPAAPESADDRFIEFVTTLTGGEEPFAKPADMVRDSQGNLYVLEGSDQILKYDKEGNFVLKWGGSGKGDGQFIFGIGGYIAIDAKDNIFVSDLHNHRIQKFDQNGKFLTKWGKAGTAEEDFAAGPGGIAVDSEGNVYVVEGNQDEYGNVMVKDYKENVKVFDGNGKFLAKWGTPGDDVGQLKVPTDIEIDTNDTIYIANQFNGWVNKFDTQGKSLGGIKYCAADSQNPMRPTGLALDRDGNLYVSNIETSRICIFTAEGKFVGAWGTYGSGAGQFLSVWDLMADEDGTLYATDYNKNQILVFKQKSPSASSAPAPATIAPTIVPPTTAPGAPAATSEQESGDDSIVEYVTAFGDGKKPLEGPATPIIDAQGNMYLLQASNQILKLTKEGEFVTKWGSYGAGDGQFEFGYGGDIAIDPSGNVFITDTNNHRVQKFDPDGKFLLKWGKYGTGDGEFVLPGGIAVDTRGNVYVADNNADPNGNPVVRGYVENVQVFDGNGKFLAKWGTHGNEMGQLNNPTDIEIDSADNVYISSMRNGWVNKFDSQGELLSGWRYCSPQSTNPMAPTGLALDRQGNVYVANYESRRICKFSADGNFLGAWGRHSSENGAFLSMVDLVVDDNGMIYVPDIEKNQVLVFKQRE